MQDNHAKLQAAVAEVARLRGELKAIEREVSARRFATMRSCTDKSQPPMSLAASLIKRRSRRSVASIHSQQSDLA
jgi:aconitase A